MSFWVPTHLTFKECQQIEAECYRKLGIEPPTPAQRYNPSWQAEYHKKLDAWMKDNPGEPWIMDRLMEEDQKRAEQKAAEKQA